MAKTNQSKRGVSATDGRRKAMTPKRVAVVGISNRKSPAEEAEERRTLPPRVAEPLVPEDAGGDKGERGFTRDGGQTSHKAGARSVAQKEAGSKYSDRSTPGSHKVAGAFAKEPRPAAANRRQR